MIYVISFLLAVFKGSIIVCVGILLRNHLETILSMILRKPLPEEMINSNKYERTMNIIRTIGLFVILIGIITMLFGLLSFVPAFGVRHNSFNLQF